MKQGWELELFSLEKRRLRRDLTKARVHPAVVGSKEDSQTLLIYTKGSQLHV